VAATNGLGVVVVEAPGRRARARTANAVAAEGDDNGAVLRVRASDGTSEVRRLQIIGRVVATVGGSSFAPLAAGDLPIGVTGHDGRAPDGSHVICPGGLADAARVLAACRPARQASRESANLSLAGAVAGALLAVAPAIGPRRLPRVLTAIDTAALAAVGNAVRHARRAETAGSDPDGADSAGIPGPVPVPVPESCGDDEEQAALA
jgi:cation-transporting P-type ATPase I